MAIAALVFAAVQFPSVHPVSLRIPQGWPKPTYALSANPLTHEGIALGRKLFYDPILSADSVISCSNCHLSYTAFTHVDHALSHGIRDSIGTRNSPALMNLAWNNTFMWDGAVNHLDMQALAPINHPGELGGSTAQVLSKLQRSRVYPKLFGRAFGDTIITVQHMLKSLAQFELTLISANSKYDRVTRQEGGEQFTAQEANGHRIFQAHCAACHREPLFTTGEFANNGLAMDTTLRDVGRMRITQDVKDSLKFKIPTLRNIEFTFPYMHDGRFLHLRDVIAQYTDGIMHSSTLAPELQAPIALSTDERTDLLAFLLTLSDREFLFNPNNAYPRE
jgi:cytochrome c peroxidase